MDEVTDYPYSQQWRERTRERMAALDRASENGFDCLNVARATGLEMKIVYPAVRGDGDVSLEVAGPIDELLDRLEEMREADAIRECVVHHPGVGSPRVRKVEGVSLDALLDCRIELTPDGADR